MSDQTSVETITAPASSYQTVGSGFQASTTDAPEMTFMWTASVASGDQAAINITVNYGGGTDTSNVQSVQIPWGWTGAIHIPNGSNPAISVIGSVSAVYSTDASVVVVFNGNMVYGGMNNIVALGTIVAACMATS